MALLRLPTKTTNNGDWALGHRGLIASIGSVDSWAFEVDWVMTSAAGLPTQSASAEIQHRPLLAPEGKGERAGAQVRPSAPRGAP